MHFCKMFKSLVTRYFKYNAYKSVKSAILFALNFEEPMEGFYVHVCVNYGSNSLTRCPLIRPSCIIHAEITEKGRMLVHRTVINCCKFCFICFFQNNLQLMVDQSLIFRYMNVFPNCLSPCTINMPGAKNLLRA